MKKTIIALVCIVYAISVSGCIAAALVGGAAGATYFNKNYDVSKKDENGEADTDQASDDN